MSEKKNRAALAMATLMLVGRLSVLAGPPGLTAPGTYVDTTYTWNLGPTGCRGWMYNEGNEWLFVPEGLSSQSRQILITHVDSGSPAWGVLATNDVILGIGSALFTNDARKSLAVAIGEAEKTENAGALRLKVWRSGVTNDNVTVTLRVVGTYSDTAPYDCPKSALILSNACDYMATQAINSGYTEGNAVIGLALLAAGRTQDLAKVQAYARSVAPQNLSLTIPVNAMVAWPWGYNNLFLSEYFLATGDTNVLHAINEYSATIARGQSAFGTYGHGMAWSKSDGSSTHGFVPVYGALDQAGLVCNLSMVMGRKCGAADPEVDPAIARGRRFFGHYAGQGSIPYGEGTPEELHDDNGRNATAGLLMALQEQDDMTTQAQWFAKMCTAGYALREFGHTGPGFCTLWQALGANIGGTNALSAYFKQIRWHLDLLRRWDGTFAYDAAAGGKPGEEYLGKNSATAFYMLTYAAPLRKLYITGKNPNPAHWLSTNDVAEAISDGRYTLGPDIKAMTTNELVDALGSWSPQKRRMAATELGTRANAADLVPNLLTLAEGPNVNERMGACQALGSIKSTNALAVLARRLNDSDSYVRFLAAQSLEAIGQSARPVLLDMLSTLVTNELPIEPINWSDPAQCAQGALGSAAFNGQLSSSVTGVNTNFLYPAIGAMSRSYQRAGALDNMLQGSALSTNAVKALAPVLVTMLMTGHEICDCNSPQAVINLLSRHNVEEGISAAMIFRFVESGRGWLPYGASTSMNALQKYRSAARTTLPELYYWNTNADISALGMSVGDFSTTIAVIENDTNPPPALLYFKTITSASATPAVFTNPVASTSLKASARSVTGDPLTYTWSKVRGAGPVSFSTNGTAASSNCTAAFTIPGSYVLKLTVADAYVGDGTNGYGGVVANLNVTFNDVSNPVNLPPTADPQSVSLNESTSQAITLTGSDPEGYELYYALASYPTHGTLSGTAPNLTYTPWAYFNGADSFTFTVMDSEGHVSPAATVSITVNGVNNIPVALNRSLPVATNTPTAVLLDGSDIDGDPLTYTVLTQPTHGVLSGTAPNLVYTPAAAYNDTDSFTFKVNDGKVDSTNIATVTISMGTIYTGIYSEFFQNPPYVNGWPDMANLLPDTTRIDAQMNFGNDDWPSNYVDHFSSRHIAYVKIPTNGIYTFMIGADDNTRVYVDESWVIEQFFPDTVSSAPLQLTPGYHGIRVEYTEGYGENHFTLYWAGPGFGQQVVPANVFFRCVGNTGPGAPADLEATPGNASVALAWSAAARAESYNVKRALGPGGPYATLASGVAATSYTDSSLTNGTTYYYVVSATADGGEGLNSVEAYATPVSTVTINVNYKGGASAAMNGVLSSDATARGSASRVAPVIYSGNTWNDFSSANGFNSANLLDSTGGSTGVGLATTTDNTGIWADWNGLGGARMLISGRIAGYLTYQPILTFTNLNPGHGYHLYIAGLHNDNNRPEDFRVGAVEKHIENNPGGSTDWAEGVNYAHFLGLGSGSGGTLTVEGKMTSAGSGYMVLNGFQLVDVGAQAPGTPAGLTASGGNVQVNLNWAAAVGAAGYNVKRSLTFDGLYTLLATTAATNYTDTAVVNGATYYYKLSATNAVGESSDAGWCRATPLPPIPLAPSSISATPGNLQVSLAWAPSTGATGYIVKRSPASGGPYAMLGTASGVTCTDFAVTNGVTYYYVVSATNMAGEGANSSETSARPMPPLPSVPAGLVVTGTSNQVALSWAAAAEATGYNVKRSLTDGGPYALIGTASGTNYADNAVTSGITYYFVVSATNLSGESANSASVSATPVTVIPTVPVGLAAAAAVSQVNLCWSASPGATGYDVKRSLASNGTFTVVGTAEGASYADNAVTNGTTYFYKVSATNSAGASADCPAVGATPAVVAINVDYSIGLNGTAWTDVTYGGTASHAAPVAYLGTSWNPGGAGVAIGALKDSTNGATSVGVSAVYPVTGHPTDWVGFNGVKLCKGTLAVGRTPGGLFQGVYRPLFTLAGLLTNHTYNLTFAGKRDASSTIIWYKYGNQESSATNKNSGDPTDWTFGKSYTSLTNLIPRANGEVMVQARLDTNAAYADNVPLSGWQLVDNGVNTKSSMFADIVSFGCAAESFWGKISGTNISLTVPYDAVLTSFTPDFDISVGANCTPAPGVPQDFSAGPVIYTVVSQDLSATNRYRATVTASTYPVVINVNYCRDTEATMNGIYSMNPANSMTASRSAPAAYSGNIWNDLTTATWNVPGGTPGVDGLVDSLNGNTGIGLTTLNFSTVWVDWGAAGLKLKLLDGSASGAAAAIFTNIITLSCLNTNHTYDLYIARQHGWNARTTVYEVGATFKTNTMTGSMYNLGDWAEGTNYVRFAGVRPDGSGAISVRCKDTSELGLNGFQLVDLGPGVPPAPGGVTASGTNAQVNLSWTASLDAMGYNVKRSLVSGGPYSAIGTAASTIYADNAVVNGTRYYYAVSATNMAGESANSLEANAMPMATSTESGTQFYFR